MIISEESLIKYFSSSESSLPIKQMWMNPSRYFGGMLGCCREVWFEFKKFDEDSFGFLIKEAYSTCDLFQCSRPLAFAFAYAPSVGDGSFPSQRELNFTSSAWREFREHINLASCQ